MLGRSGDLNLVFTAETRRHGVTPSRIQNGDVENGNAQRERRAKTLAQRVSAGKESNKISSAGGAVLTVMRVLVATVREIFDENAYDRFLTRTDSVRSTISYRAFMQEREAGIATKPRCC
jgi:hypothetical protein